MAADLSTAQLEKLKIIFEQALSLSPNERAEFLRAQCGDDHVLRNEVESLLNAHEESDGFFEALSDEVVRPALAAAPHTRDNHGNSESAERDVLKLAGRTISHFHVQEPLAAGGMGVVYRATDTHLGRPVALKFPLPGARLEHEIRERFLREARGAGALDHPNICSIYEAGQTEDGQLFLAMPLYAGETLKARLEREGRLPVDASIGIAEQIARGLHAAARAGIVHRDLKPANVMILPDGTVKILDFGIARVSDVMLTASHATLGTVPYMAPEHVLGDEVDSRADIWALGVLLYEMLTGQRPFGGKHQIAVAHSIVHSDPLPPSKLRPEIPAKLENLVLWMLAKQPENRPASAEVVVAELGGAKALSLQSHGHLPPSPTVRVSRRPLMLAAAVALIAVAAGVTWWQMHGKPAAGASDPRIIAVLPFTEAGASDNSAYLGAALAAEFSAALSRSRSVAIPAEPSISEVAASVTAPATIANLLGAATVVRGNVRWTGNDVTLQLAVFDSLRKGDVWTREYTSPAGNVLALQKRAMEGIVSALDLDISRAERATLLGVPAVSGEAYDLYLKGRAAQLLAGSGGARSSDAAELLQNAQSYFARARETDRSFAAARAHLALTQLVLARDDRTSARRDQARLEAEAALRLRPGMSEAHEALARYWELRGDRSRAAAEAERALAGRPNAPHLHIFLGTILRSLARWEEALAAFDRATRLDPRNRGAHRQAASTYARIRRYEDAIAHWDRMIAMDSARDPIPQIMRGFSYLRLGNVDSLDAAVSRVPLAPDARGITTYARYIVHRIKGRSAQLLAVLDSARFPIFSDSLIYVPVILMRAQTFESMGDAARARANYEAARSLLEDSVAAHPRDARMRIALGLAYAGLRRRADAMREARTATEIVPLSERIGFATAFMGGAVEVYARLGEADAALELIEMLLAMPAGREISVPLLRADPVYDKLRSDPRFNALLDRFSRS